MKKLFFTFLLLTQCLVGFSRFSDNFSNGNFTSNPNWSGGLGVFEFETRHKLRLIDRKAEDGLLLKAGIYIIVCRCFQKVVVLSR